MIVNTSVTCAKELFPDYGKADRSGTHQTFDFDLAAFQVVDSSRETVNLSKGANNLDRLSNAEKERVLRGSP